ncbi:MAG TPA: choice-of-anchor tandem repeat GloVer-containing protein [Bryobacteraceae bacterium]|nr:choice-of-anchor tandem repeat GloVer-containing protein [Bryobacteraceae bacterium]
MATTKPKTGWRGIHSGQKRWLACLLLAATAMAQSSPTEIVLHNFQAPPNGLYPYAGVVADSAGNLYGTTNEGGTSNQGLVFKVDPSGHETILFEFTGSTGSGPRALLTLDAAGNIYGTTRAGGAVGKGVVFKLDSTGRQTILHSFHGGTDGSGPSAGVVLDAVGNLYGTAPEGGRANCGVVYKIDTARHETILYSFAGADGCTPSASVTLDSSGNIYGTTQYGGSALRRRIQAGCRRKRDRAVQLQRHLRRNVSRVQPGSGLCRQSLWHCQVRWRGARRGSRL